MEKSLTRKIALYASVGAEEIQKKKRKIDQLECIILTMYEKLTNVIDDPSGRIEQYQTDILDEVDELLFTEDLTTQTCTLCRTTLLVEFDAVRVYCCVTKERMCAECAEKHEKEPCACHLN